MVLKYFADWRTFFEIIILFSTIIPEIYGLIIGNKWIIGGSFLLIPIVAFSLALVNRLVK